MPRSIVMRMLCLTGFMSTLLFSITASCEMATHRRGLNLGLRTGINQCIDDDDRGSCTDVTVGGGFGMLTGVRFLPFMSVDLDLGMYFFGQDEVDSLSLMDIMLELRVYVPLKMVDIYGKFGGGFMQMTFMEENSRLKASSWANMKWGGGFTVFFLRKHRIGDMGIGMDFDFLWTNLKKIEICEDDDCESLDEGDGVKTETGAGVNAFQYSVHWRWVLPVFGRAG